MNRSTFRPQLKCILQIGAFFIISVLFVLRLSYSTSFLYPGCFGSDSAIFQLIGKYWAQGVLPYQQLFDHKGPLIFLLDAIGYVIHGRSGILVLQTISLTIAIWGFFRTCRLWMNGYASCISTGITLLYLARTFDEGNMTEEYSLPFLAISLYFICRWYQRQKNETSFSHPWQYAAIYGVCFAGILMLRVTNAILICSFVLVITLALCITKQCRSLLANAAGFVGGFFAFFGPFMLYFWAKGALWDMLYGTIFYNIFYSTEFSIVDYYAHHQWAASTIRRVLFDFGAPLFLLLAISILVLVRNRKNLLAWGGVVSSLVSMYVLFTNRPYVHYFMIVTALLPLIFILTVELWQQRKQFVFGGLSAPLLCLVWLISLCLRLPGWSTDNFLIHYSSDVINYNFDALSAVSFIPEEDRNSVLGYNIDAQWYLATDIQPCQTYFIHQDWQSAADINMQNEISKQLWQNPPKWMVVSNPSNPAVQQLLAEQYSVVLGEEQGYSNYTVYQKTTQQEDIA